MKKWMLAAVVLVATAVQAQNDNCAYLGSTSVSYLKKTVQYLASDNLKGRYPGSPADAEVQTFLSSEFKKWGLKPIFEKGMRQEFSFPDGVTTLAQTYLSVNGKALKAGYSFYPVQYSAPKGKAVGTTVFVNYGIVAPELEYNDMADKNIKGKVVVMDVSSPDGIHPHSNYAKYHSLSKRIHKLEERGATAVLLINTQGNANDPRKDFSKLNSSGLPVIFVADDEQAQLLKRPQAVELLVAVEEKIVETANIAGLIDNGADNTIIIGAHFDHLGMGGSSSLFTGKPAIHNGADDNASGTAGLLALARYLAKAEVASLSGYNYLMVAFSGEEKGLLGSNYLVENLNLEHYNPRYMLNMDMIGRMEQSALAVNGTGTTPVWDELLDKANCGLEIKKSATGTGPSDHTNFYYQEMPVLHFFTGTHKDYHKPTDDYEYINVEGMQRTLNFMLRLIDLSTQFKEMVFTPTKDDKKEAARFTVTLGVMPDYMYSGQGMKIDGVSPGKTAAKAGLKAGDVVKKMGAMEIEDIYQYMEALAQYKVGDSTTVTVQRGEEEITRSITFK